MEKGLNIAAILKEKPKEAKLYDVLREMEVRLYDVYVNFDKKEIIRCVTTIKGSASSFKYSYNGTTPGYINGLQILKPSKKMQDWSKFAWKKGDVLSDRNGSTCIFCSWTTDEYIGFDAMYHNCAGKYDYSVKLPTRDFTKASDEEAKKFIKELEESHGGRLNLETLEIEHTKQEFDDGDIVYVKTKYGTEYIIAYKAVEKTSFYIAYNLSFKTPVIQGCAAICRNSEIDTLRLATEEEKQQLFDALAKKNKRWNPDTKTIESLPKKCEFKAFDKVLVRDSYDSNWHIDFFSYYKKDSTYPYRCLRTTWKECIPYNEETKHLLGTTDEWKGGEG